MDINNILRGAGSAPSKSLNQTETVVSRKADGKSEPSVAANVAAKSETVTLTDTASRLRQATQPSTSKTEVNSERVASLRAALADGSYKPNVGVIAARLLAFESALKS